MKPWRIVSVAILVATFVVIRGSAPTRAKVPAWQPNEHPRLIASPAEQAAIVAKLTAPGTPSNLIWSSFLTNSFKNNSRNYADGAFQYWVTGDATIGNQAVVAAESWIDSLPNGINPTGSSFNDSWYNYLDLLLTYDFTYDLIAAQGKKTKFIEYIARQGAECDAAGPGYAPGNMNTLWMYCEYASAMLLEGENISINAVDEPVSHGLPNSAQPLSYVINDSNFKITNAPGQAMADYTENVDYVYRYVSGCGARCIDWSPTGTGTKEPATGSIYYVTYAFTPQVANWKSSARSAIEYHLNYQWHDGYYQGGLNPYGSLVTEELPVFIEMLRRDTGLDYSQNFDVKRIVDMYMYSKLPSTNTGVPRRFNTINDTGGWTNYDADAWSYPSPTFPNYKSWLRPFVAWSTSAYANDPDGYGQRYAWLWTQAYRNPDGTIRYTPVPDWREALWINDAVLAPYINTTAAPSASWPTVRYFRGKEIIYARTDGWNTPDPNATLMSVVAGNHNYQNEHDQGDAGSFTFFSAGDDWAIDPGYGDADTGDGLNLYDHNSVGIDGGGYNISGAYSVPAATANFGGFAHFDDVALSAGASTAIANLTNAWTLTATPYVQRDLRYTTMISGAERPYLIVADDIQKDSSTHSYEWYLHTGIGNTASISGNRATITGGRAGAAMDLYSLGPESVTITSADSYVGNLGTHKRLVVKASGVQQARFLHLLIPGSPGAVKPTITNSAVIGGTQAVVSWPDGTADTVLWRYTGSSITSTNGIDSDAKLTVVRSSGSSTTGLVAVAGRSVQRDSAPLLSVADGSAPVTVSAFGATAALYATDAAVIRLALPFVTAATVEDGAVSIPVYNDGTAAFINAGLPLAEVRRGNGVRFAQDFNNSYVGDLFRFNLSRHPAEQFGVVNGALELRETPSEWPSFSKRDSTPWRRTGIFPTVIPPLDHADANFAWRFKFSDGNAQTKKFSAYFRVRDRNPVDWITNQDYVRVEFNAMESNTAKNQVTVGQRINGAWAAISDNDVLTASLPSVSPALNDTNWHTANVKLLGNDVTVTVDGVTAIAGTLPTAIPTAPASGYTQWKVTGQSSVLLDDVLVTAIDRTPPVAPTSGDLRIAPGGAGTVTLTYGHGNSTDAQGITLYESATPIQPADNPVGLPVVGSSTSSFSTLTFSGADRTKYHALTVTDPSGNRSQLLPLTVDLTPPSMVSDLQAQ
ncbi:MAG: heparinase II/III family protein [Patescibacteria group bacterium]|mgnify:CR=1 FL=1